MQKKYIATTLLALAGLIPLHAADPVPPATAGESTPAATESPADLPEVVVTATRTPTEAIKVPAQVRQLSSADFQERQVRTLPEALKEIPGVSVQKTGNGQGSPYIRGFTGFRNLLLIDGIRFNNSIFRDGPNQYWNTVDSYSVDRLELVPGQGSVLYGSDAIGGTLNLFTKDSGFRDEAPGSFFHGLTSYRGSTAEESNMAHQEFQVGEGGRWGLHIGASLKSFGDVHSARVGDQPHTGYDEWAYDVRLDVALDANWTLTAVHQQLRQNDAWRTHSTIYGVSFEGTAVGTDLRRSFDQDRTLSYLRVAGQNIDGFVNAASLTVSLQTANENEHRIQAPAKDTVTYTQIELSTLGVDLQLESQTPVGRLTYGIDYYRDWVSSGNQRYRLDGSFVSTSVQGPVGDDSTYDLLGAYLQDAFDIGSRVHVYIGARYTYAAANVGHYDDPAPGVQDESYSDSWNDFSASGRVVLDLDDKDRFKLFAAVSQGFRAPNLSDVSRFDTALSGETELPSPNLDPEQFINFEVGLKAETAHFTGSLSYYYTLIDNMIVRRPVGNNSAVKSNAGEGFIQGIEVAGEYRFDSQWSVFGHVAWNEGEVDQFPRPNDPTVRNEYISKAVPLVGRAGIRWQSPDRRFWSEFVCLAHAQYDNLTSGDKRDVQRVPPEGNPSFAILTLRGGWQVTKNIGVTLALENLLDEEYRYAGSGSNEPGFGVVAGATIKF